MATTKELNQLIDQQSITGRIKSGALSDIEGLITGECPFHHDAEFLRTEISRVLAEMRASIDAAKQEYLAGEWEPATLAPGYPGH